MKLGTPDLVILVAYLAAVVLFGIWMGRRPQSVADYVVSGRDVPWWVVLCSIVATETSTVTFLSIPGFAFGKDLTWLQLPLGYIIGRLLVVVLLLPRYFQGSFFTAYELLERRFGGATRRVASGLFIVTRSLADGLRLYLTAVVLWKIFGMDLRLAVVCIGLATILYTFMGGMRAVLWTDFVQFVVYSLGACVALGVLLHAVGGWQELDALAGAAGKWHMLDFDLDPSKAYTLWAGLLGGAFLTLGTHGADQMMVQRYLSARSLRDARRALTASGFVVLAQFAVFLVIGVALWAFYQKHPPAQAFAKNDHVFASFIVDHMPVGVRGLVLGAVFSAAMSTLSSSLNSSATALVNDVLGMRAERDGRRMLALIRAYTVFFGVVQIGVGAAGQWPQSVVAAVLAIAGFTTGIILGIFFLGVFTKRVGQRAALCGLLCGLFGMSFVAFGTALAWPWYALVGSLGTFAVGVVASLFWPAPP